MAFGFHNNTHIYYWLQGNALQHGVVVVGETDVYSVNSTDQNNNNKLPTITGAGYVPI